MITKNISLRPPYESAGINGQGLSPVLTCMIHDSQPERKYPAVIAVPGGSYEHCSKREGEPSAARWYSYGYNGFVLDYSCVKKPFPTALLELASAVEYIRSNADELCCDGRIILCGFSAGGHLAASLGVHSERYSRYFSENIRPDAMVLCYPVITTGEFTHKLSAENIAGDDAALRSLTSLEEHVSAEVPPTYIWHCADDNVVPVENSLMFSTALSRNKIPFEMHIFPKGGHGIAMCDITTIKNNDPRYINETAASWFEEAQRFVKSVL